MIPATEPFDARAWVAHEVGCGRFELALLKEARHRRASTTTSYRYLRGGAVCAVLHDTLVEPTPPETAGHRVLTLEVRGRPAAAVPDIELPVEQPVRW